MVITEEKLKQIISESIAQTLNEAEMDEGLGKLLGKGARWLKNGWGRFANDFKQGYNPQSAPAAAAQAAPQQQAAPQGTPQQGSAAPQAAPASPMGTTRRGRKSQYAYANPNQRSSVKSIADLIAKIEARRGRDFGNYDASIIIKALQEYMRRHNVQE